jgi:hypothetical protein
MDDAYATIRGCRSPLEAVLQILLPANDGQDMEMSNLLYRVSKTGMCSSLCRRSLAPLRAKKCQVRGVRLNVDPHRTC